MTDSPSKLTYELDKNEEIKDQVKWMDSNTGNITTLIEVTTFLIKVKILAWETKNVWKLDISNSFTSL